MKTTVYFLIAFIVVASNISCSKKHDTPSKQVTPIVGVLTNQPDSVTATSALFLGSISGSNDFSTVTAWGFCWGTDSLPTLANHVVNAPLTGDLLADVSGLTESTTYHVRAYATNSAGTTYGS